MGKSGWREVGVEVALMFPGCPADPGEFIGESTGGLVVTDTGLEFASPVNRAGFPGGSEP